MVLTLVSAGLDYHFVVDLDIYSFNSVIEAHFRKHAKDRMEYAQTTQIATQGTGKDLTKWIKKRFMPLLGTKSKVKEARNDQASFLKDFGKGI
jgi:hypothetical protein